MNILFLVTIIPLLLVPLAYAQNSTDKARIDRINACHAIGGCLDESTNSTEQKQIDNTIKTLCKAVVGLGLYDARCDPSIIAQVKNITGGH
jgi:hypothetical protein